jgi:MFS family permease
MSGPIQLDLDPSPQTLRQFGFIALGVFTLLAALAHFELLLFAGGLGAARDTVAVTLFLVGGASGLFSLLAPRANRALWVGLSLAAYPIGFVVSHVLLALLFFGLFAPLGLLLKALGKDQLQRRGAREATYWRRARRPRSSSDYFRRY